MASTFLALAAVGFIKLGRWIVTGNLSLGHLDPPFLWTLAARGLAAALEVLGRVLVRPAVVVVGAAFPALPRLIEFATELREAPELDLVQKGYTNDIRYLPAEVFF